MNTLIIEAQTTKSFDQMDSSEQELTPEQAAILYIQEYMVEENSKDPKQKERENVVEIAHIGAAIYGPHNNQVVLTPEQLSVASIVQALTQQDNTALRNAQYFLDGDREIITLENTAAFLQKEYYRLMLEEMRLQRQLISTEQEEKLVLIKYKLKLLRKAALYFN